MAVEVKRCVIISGAPENNVDYYKDYINDDTYVICADSGYIKCESLKIIPDIIIGDFDSSSCPNDKENVIKLEVRKNDTDTFYCVKYALQNGYNDITILGGIGSRIDHTYANVMSLVYCDEHKAKARLVNNSNLITIISGNNRIENNGFKYFSLYSLFEKCENVTISNASYNISGVDIYPNEQFAQSNEFLSGPAEIYIEKGKMILFLCND